MIDLFLRAESEAELQQALANAGVGTLTTSFLNLMATAPIEVLSTVQIPTMTEVEDPFGGTRLVQAMTTTEVSFMGLTMTQEIAAFTVAEITSLIYPITETTVQLSSYSPPTGGALNLDVLGTINRQVGTTMVEGMTQAMFEPLSGFHANLRVNDGVEFDAGPLEPVTIKKPNNPYRVYC